MSASNRFIIDQWSAWAPGISTQDHWRSYSPSQLPVDPEVKADVSFLPAMQRRRLSPLAKAVFFVVNAVNTENEQCPSIFCSTYGEAQRTYAILEDIAKKEDVSPTAFSLSVHNAISGQYTILFGNRQPTTALAPKAEDYLIAIIDALGQLKAGSKSALVVFYEEALPAFYQPYAESISFPCALALKIRLAEPEDESSYTLQLDPSSPARQPGASLCPPLLELITSVASETNSSRLGRWQLSKQ